MTVYAITDTKKGEQGLRLLILKLPATPFSMEKLEWLGYTRQWKNFEDIFIRFRVTYERDRQTDTGWRHTALRLCIAR